MDDQDKAEAYGRPDAWPEYREAVTTELRAAQADLQRIATELAGWEDSAPLQRLADVIGEARRQAQHAADLCDQARDEFWTERKIR